MRRGGAWCLSNATVHETLRCIRTVSRQRSVADRGGGVERAGRGHAQLHETSGGVLRRGCYIWATIFLSNRPAGGPPGLRSYHYRRNYNDRIGRRSTKEAHPKFSEASYVCSSKVYCYSYTFRTYTYAFRPRMGTTSFILTILHQLPPGKDAEVAQICFPQNVILYLYRRTPHSI